MGVRRDQLPDWGDMQGLTAQRAKPPPLDDAPVVTQEGINPNAQTPLTLTLKIPLFVSDISFGTLSEPATIALAKGIEDAGTGICSGEGGMLRGQPRA